MTEEAFESQFADVELEDYKDNAEFYELEERARPDEMAMIHGAGMEALAIARSRGKATVLDLCCGTGLSHELLVNDPSISRIVGVDISEPYLEFARSAYASAKTVPSYILGDVVTHPLPVVAWDIVMMCSAYHHIEDSRKVDFLKRVRGLIQHGGRGIFAENILPAYSPGDTQQYSQSVRLFYESVLETARKDNPALPEVVERLIWRVAQYGFDGEYEYKVSYDIFQAHLNEAGLEVVKEQKVWPSISNNLLGTGGNYVVVVKARDA
jgi:SAM-dependent methyltransferase